MRRILLIALAAACWNAPAGAQLNTYYKGTVREGGQDGPLTAQFSVEAGRVAMIMRGTTTRRMLFLESEQVLRLVDDTHGSYVDLGNASGPGSMAAGMAAQMAEMQKQLDKLPPEQRRMMQGMMQGRMGATPQAQTPDQYVWSTEHKTISGYDATRVDIMQGTVKKAEYWGTKSPDFRMSDAERSTMLAMQAYLRNYLITVTPAGGGQTRAFEWDTGTDGYPVLTRCFNGDEMTLELQLQSVDRKALPGDLFAIPANYQKQEFAIPGAR
jgi:hypothetical protein